jgi:hypothetical protein
MVFYFSLFFPPFSLAGAKSTEELDADKKDGETPAGEGAAAEPAAPVLSAEEEAAIAAEKAAREEEEKMKTLAEYKAERAKPAVELPPARKAGEGADETKWKGTVVLEKADEVYYSKVRFYDFTTPLKVRVIFLVRLLNFVVSSLIGEKFEPPFTGHWQEARLVQQQACEPACCSFRCRCQQPEEAPR